MSPETGILDRFVLESVQPALGYDALTSSHPISIPVNHPNEISEIFDTISYLKVGRERSTLVHLPTFHFQGGSVIRMMANFLGVSTFNRGIANYLHAYSLSNANQDNLWSFLTAVGQVLYLLKRLQNLPTSTFLAGGWNSGGQNCEGGDGHMDRANGIPSGHHQ